MASVLRCPSCGCERHYSHEHELKVRAGRFTLTPCPDCRRARPKPDESDRQFWLERFTLEECRDLGEAIFT